MKALFVDTGAFLAKEIASDQYHLVGVGARYLGLRDRMVARRGGGLG